MAIAWKVLASIKTAEGALELRQRGEREFLITIAGRVLMTSVARRSEEALSTLACAKLSAHSRAPRVVIGGLGMGFTLRAALDSLPRDARVCVVELTPEVASWCRGPLAALTDSAVSDPRVDVKIADIAAHLAASPPGAYDAVLLDLYEGPNAASQVRDDPFYGATAITRTHAALSESGVFAIWSEEADAAFERRLTAGGFSVSVHRAGKGGRSHFIYLGIKTRVK